MTNTNKRCPGTISFVRFKLGLTQQQFADTLGVSRSLIAMMETGKRQIPRFVMDIYLQLSDKAAAINPDAVIIIKRGRKPAQLPTSVVVTNYGSTADKSDKDACIDVLQKKKRMLYYQHVALQFKKERMEEKAHLLSDQLIYVNAMLDNSRKLFDTLPAGRVRDKYELMAAFFYAKQIKLRQELKKIGPVAVLQTEYQMNVLERQMEVVGEFLDALENGTQMTRIGQIYTDRLSIAAGHLSLAS